MNFRASKPRIRPLATLAFVAAVLVAVAGCASLDSLQREAIFQPTRSERVFQQHWFAEPPPGTERYALTLANGDRLEAWYLAHDDRSAPTVLYLHGARWPLDGSVFRIERWHELGFNVLAIDYRGFGRSTTLLPSEQTASEDVRAAFDELARREPDPHRRFVYGHSLGGALAIDLASHEDRFAGLVVESSFTSIRDVIGATSWSWIPFVSMALTQRFDSLAKASAIRVPVLFVHGTADAYVPHTMSDRLYAAACGAPLRRLAKIAGASHSGAAASGPAYADAVLHFVHDASMQAQTAGRSTVADAGRAAPGAGRRQ